MDGIGTDASISVVVPCFNGMPFLPEALRSAREQTRPAAEILVVDDGSRDDSAACVRDEAARWPRAGIRLIQQPNRGESAARNTGIRAATSRWVAQLDADDWWAPAKLAAQIEAAAAAGPPCVLVHTGQITDHPDGRATPIPLEPAAERVGWCTRQLIEPVGLSHSSVLARRDAMLAIGGYDEQLAHAVDIDVYFKLSAMGTFAFVPVHLVHYRRHEGQTSWNHKLDQVRSHHQVVRRFFAAHPDLAAEIGHAAIDAGLARHLETKLESFWWHRRLAPFRQLLDLAEEEGLDSPGLRRWRRRGRWPAWLVLLRDRLSRSGSRR